MTDSKPLDHTPLIRPKKVDSTVAGRKPYSYKYIIQVKNQMNDWIDYHKCQNTIPLEANEFVLQSRKEPYRIKHKGEVIKEWKPE
jgi:hypothetical protein